MSTKDQKTLDMEQPDPLATHVPGTKGSISPDQVIDGKFVIKEELSRGGMGVVFRATQLSLQRDVALKVLSTMDLKEALPRFQQEASATARLQHPNTIRTAWGVV